MITGMVRMDKKLILIGIVLIFVVSGCSEGGLGRGKKNPITEVDVRKGTDGLKIEFLPNSPPQNVFAEIGFPISLKIKNIGAFDIAEDNKETSQIESGIVVFGFEKAYMDIPEGKVLFDVKGKSIYAPLGDEEFIIVNARAGAIGPQSETHPSTIFATACYPYETIFGASVCIDTDIIGESEKGQKACIVKDLAFTNGQGAPVSVTKVETRMLPQDDGKIKPHFLIYVKNAGNGQVINISKIDRACSSEQLDYKDFNTLKVNATLSGVELDCDPAEGMQKTAEARLRDKEDLIRCTYDGGGGIDAGLDAYVAPLRVELDYGYTFTISKNIIIEKVLTH